MRKIVTDFGSRPKSVTVKPELVTENSLDLKSVMKEPGLITENGSRLKSVTVNYKIFDRINRMDRIF